MNAQDIRFKNDNKPRGTGSKGSESEQQLDLQTELRLMYITGCWQEIRKQTNEHHYTWTSMPNQWRSRSYEDGERAQKPDRETPLYRFDARELDCNSKQHQATTTQGSRWSWAEGRRGFKRLKVKNPTETMWSKTEAKKDGRESINEVFCFSQLLLCSTWSSWVDVLDNIWINRRKSHEKKQNQRKLRSIGLAPTHPPSIEKFAASRISCLFGIRRYLNSSRGRRREKKEHVSISSIFIHSLMHSCHRGVG